MRVTPETAGVVGSGVGIEAGIWDDIGSYAVRRETTGADS